MIKVICDRCGAEMADSFPIGYISLNFKEGLRGDLMLGNPLENNHYCLGCMNEIQKFIKPKLEIKLAEPAEGTSELNSIEADAETRTGDPELVAIEEPAPELKSEPEAEMHKPDDIEAAPEPDVQPGKPKTKKIVIPAKKPRGTIDYGKIMALRNAGWSREKIADEMGMTLNAVSNAIYVYKKRLAEKEERG